MTDIDNNHIPDTEVGYPDRTSNVSRIELPKNCEETEFCVESVGAHESKKASHYSMADAISKLIGSKHVYEM